MNNAPSKIHLITRAYLAQWASDGYLRPVHREWGSQKLRTPAAVGWRKSWWGEDDPQLNTTCEQMCNQLETQVPDLLRRLPYEWPAAPEMRSPIAQFIVLHIVRTEGFADWLDAACDKSLSQHTEDFSPEQYQAISEQVRSPQERARRCFGMINKMSTIIASMHWTLMTFDEPLLITSDQPVVAVPLLEAGERAAITAVPEAGWMDTIEIRFPLSPRLALICSWHEPNDYGPIVDGEWRHAVNPLDGDGDGAADSGFVGVACC